MSGGNARKPRLDESFDFENVSTLKYMTGELTDKCEIEWGIRNFVTALETSSRIASSPGDGTGKGRKGISITFESGQSVS
jgi:hypothetical protein